MNALRLNLFRIRDDSRDKPLRGNNGKPVSIGAIKASEEKQHEAARATVRIEGMMCEHCEATVKKALEALPFVASAEVSHEAGTAALLLSGEADEQAVKAAVEAEDYTFLGFENQPPET